MMAQVTSARPRLFRGPNDLARLKVWRERAKQMLEER